MGESTRIQGAMIAAAALLVAAAVNVVRERPVPARTAEASAPGNAMASTTKSFAALPPTTAAPGQAVPKAEKSEKAARIVGTLAWGSGPGRIGLPEEDEAHGETPFRLSAGGDGIALLDDENHRIVRMGPDGATRADVRLAGKSRARDVAVAKDGSLYVLEGEGAGSRVAMFTSDGRPRGELPIDAATAARSRSVIVSGKDVFVESHRGEITRIGDLAGTTDPAAKTVPGQPTRDGRGWLTARIPNARTGTLHVYVVERGSEAQRFSREMKPMLFVESIPVVDTDASGTIYVVVTGTRDEAAHATLLCIEPEHGNVVGSADLPVRAGLEMILDGKALDEGGIVYSVFTKDGIRVERHACP